MKVHKILKDLHTFLSSSSLMHRLIGPYQNEILVVSGHGPRSKFDQNIGFLSWGRGKIEIFSKNFVAQPERNKAFLWPTSYVGNFSWPILMSLAVSRGVARK